MTETFILHAVLAPSLTFLGAIWIIGTLRFRRSSRQASLSTPALGYARRVSRPERGPEETARITGHEAAHAVVAHMLGLEVVSVSVERIGNSDGRVFYGLTHSTSESESLAVVTATMAGMIWDHLHGRHDTCSCDDVSHALRESLNLVSMSEKWMVPDVWDVAAMQARAILADQAGMVDAVAARLTDEWTLDADQFLAVVRECQETPPQHCDGGRGV